MPLKQIPLTPSWRFADGLFCGNGRTIALGDSTDAAIGKFNLDPRCAANAGNRTHGLALVIPHQCKAARQNIVVAQRIQKLGCASQCLSATLHNLRAKTDKITPRSIQRTLAAGQFGLRRVTRQQLREFTKPQMMIAQTRAQTILQTIGCTIQPLTWNGQRIFSPTQNARESTQI
jgi:hypothetical protein